MRLSWIPVVVGCLLAVSISGGLQAAEPSGAAVSRVRAAIQKMRAAGKSDTEILKAVEGMLQRAAALRDQGPGRSVAPPPQARQVRQRIQAAVRKMRAEGKSPEEIRAAVTKMQQRARALMQRRAQAGAPKARGRSVAPPPQARQVRQRIQAAVRKMRAEGKSPEEIRAAVAKMKQSVLEQRKKAAQAEKAPRKAKKPQRRAEATKADAS
jgi:hypothetical protein